MKPTTIYLVWGYHSDYECQGQWAVCAYGDREQAELHCKALNGTVKAIEGLYGEYMKAGGDDDFATWRESQSAWVNRLQLDPAFNEDAQYSVVEVSLWRHFDEFQGLEG